MPARLGGSRAGIGSSFQSHLHESTWPTAAPSESGATRRATRPRRYRGSRHFSSRRSSVLVADRGAVDTIWFGRGIGPRLVRAALSPAELVYRAAIAVRSTLYDKGLLSSRAPDVPALSIGNLSVGGTGNT